ncbi:class I SAM-dependent RNA methyltransferase [Tateyamaria omphalii]|uniref:class I SAM-dependent RNA methyltransferase n=1 Tax=Tateyamaria omphalii TaxID=299262 RepID=UPI001C99096A|nr:class I SAM-dependent RNA methyltransferase [Tateyamaria omphalii]MBY5933375.1 class I SAM-dependent RNA methyltransferase [Tateyamaria omphalii]
MTTVTIDRLGQRGDGIAPGPIYAPMTLPGERVTGTLDGTHLMDVRIDTPSPGRVSPPCSHFRSCGGCQLQHASDDLVADWKHDVVANYLRNVRIETDIRPTLTSPSQSRRRASFAARRTKKGAMAGFHARKSDTIMQVPNCILITPTLRTALPICEDLAVVGASRKAALSITVTDSTTGLDFAVTGGKPLDGQLRIALASLCEQHRIARLTWEDELIGMREPPAQPMGTARVVPPPGAFLQATEHGQQTLTDLVRGIVGPAKSVVDLFAGCGTFALPLAEMAEVHAVEGDTDMMTALDAGWRQAAGLKRVTTEARDLFRRPLLSDELARFDAVVIDPPRAGAAAQMAELARAQVPVIAHVSCNPQSFARDAETLCNAGYVLDWVQPVDQFRWSTHVELVGAFRLAHIAA